MHTAVMSGTPFLVERPPIVDVGFPYGCTYVLDREKEAIAAELRHLDVTERKKELERRRFCPTCIELIEAMVAELG